jgi:hypothetical protein
LLDQARSAFEKKERKDTMIAPASIADWTMLGGLMGSLSSFAARGFRWILKEAEAEHPALEAGHRLVPTGRRAA